MSVGPRCSSSSRCTRLDDERRADCVLLPRRCGAGLVELGAYGTQSDVEQLKRDRYLLLKEVMRLRTEQSATSGAPRAACAVVAGPLPEDRSGGTPPRVRRMSTFAASRCTHRMNVERPGVGSYN